MHFQRGGVNEEARADEFVVLVVVAQDVADVLAEETLDALAEFLHAIDVLLLHAPGAVGGIGRARLELLDLLFDAEVPRNVGDEVADAGKARIGWMVTGLSMGIMSSRVMHIRLGLPLISAEHEPHLPALQFQRQARSLACVAWILCTTSSTTMPSEASVL